MPMPRLYQCLLLPLLLIFFPHTALELELTAPSLLDLVALLLLCVF